MAKRQVIIGFLLKTINSLLILTALCLLFVGVFTVVQRKQNRETLGGDSGTETSFLKVDDLHRPFHVLPSVWFVYLFLSLGTALFLVSCIGCLGTTSVTPFWLSFYSVLLIGLVLAELAVAAFLFFDQDLSQEMLHSGSNGNVHSVHHFIQTNWRIIRWVVLVALIFEIIALVLALYLRTMNRAVYDSSDDEYPVLQQAYRAATRNSLSGNARGIQL